MARMPTSLRTGPFKTIASAVSISDTNVTATTSFEAKGNSVNLHATIATAVTGDLTITAEVSPDQETTYYDSSKSWTIDGSATGDYIISLSGLEFCPGDYVRLSFQAASTGADLTLKALCWDNPGAGGASGAELAGWDASAAAHATKEVDPLSLQHVETPLVSVTNGADGTYYYYVDMDGYGELGLQLLLNGGSGTVTVTIEGTMQDDGTAQASCTYIDQTSEVYGTASYTASAILLDTSHVAGQFKYLRVKVVASTTGADDADWTVWAKKKQ